MFHFIFVMLFCLFFAALLSPAGKELTSWLSCVLCFPVFVTFLIGVLRKVWCLIVPILIFAFLSRVKSGNFGHQVTSGIHLHTVEILKRRLLANKVTV